MIYGYARVSTEGQSVAAQVAALTQAGAVKVFKETASGRKTHRVRLRALLRELQEGDTVLVTRLDRLARRSLKRQAYVLNLPTQLVQAGRNTPGLEEGAFNTA